MGFLLYVPFHIQFLNDELARRKRKNSRYSLRSFAAQLAIHPSALSRILANKQDLSLKSCVQIVKIISFSDVDKIKFIVSVAEERMHRAASFLSAACAVTLPIRRLTRAIDP